MEGDKPMDKMNSVHCSVNGCSLNPEKKENFTAIRNLEGQRIYDEKETKQIYEHYFTCLFKHNEIEDPVQNWISYVEKTVLQYLNNYEHDHSTLNRPIQQEEVSQAIKKLQNGKAPGPDQILNEFLKNGGKELEKNLLYTFQKYLNLSAYLHPGRKQFIKEKAI